MTLTKRVVNAGVSLALLLSLGGPMHAQVGPSNPPAQQGSESQPPAIDDTLEAGETDSEVPRRRLVSWNEYEGPNFTLRGGGGFLVDYAAFAQDDVSKQQIVVAPKYQLRDFRVLFGGKLKFIKSRAVTYQTGIMRDAPTNTWKFRQTGFMIGMPEIWGSIFVGRSKEGISMNKIMVGYHGWTSERSAANDAIPILADGVKWLGYAPKINMVWNLGFFGDWLSKGQSFSTYRRQVVGRAAYVKLSSPTGEKVLHVGAGLRYGVPNEGKLRLRSRPEVFPAPYFIDTGSFEAKNTKMLVPEAYYRSGPWLFGAEYVIHKANAAGSGNPLLHGGDVVVSWNATGETRPYNPRGGYFTAVSPRRTVFEGGSGAWELVARFSYVNLNGGTLSGGEFWRFTPMVNWHMSDHVRLEFSYGIGTLDRFALTGSTQFFHTRLQLSL